MNLIFLKPFRETYEINKFSLNKQWILGTLINTNMEMLVQLTARLMQHDTIWDLSSCCIVIPFQEYWWLTIYTKQWRPPAYSSCSQRLRELKMESWLEVETKTIFFSFFFFSYCTMFMFTSSQLFSLFFSLSSLQSSQAWTWQVCLCQFSLQLVQVSCYWQLFWPFSSTYSTLCWLFYSAITNKHIHVHSC